MATSQIRKSKAGKRIGRPGENDASDVRAEILKESEGLFADQGYAATSLREIADAAGVNPAMIHYYFGNKEALLRAVLEKAIEPLANMIEAMKHADAVAPEEIASQLMTLVARHPKLPYLIIREVMLPGGVMQEHFAQHLAPRLGGAVPGLLKREASAGRIRKDLPSSIGAMAILSLALFPFIVRPVAEQVMDVRLDEDHLDTFRSQISEFVKRGFSK